MAGCVKIEEPTGIQDIRTAKLEFLKAQTSLQLAEAKLTEAKAATEQGNAKLKEANVKALEIQNQRDEAKNAQEKARLDLQMKELQVQNELTILNIQTQVASAQTAYQLALADLAIAKTVDVPQKFIAQLDNVKQQLDFAMKEFNSCESQILTLNLNLNLWVAHDSLNYDYILRSNLAGATKALKNAQDMLAAAEKLKTANATDMESIKANLVAKRQAVQAEKFGVDTKQKNLTVEVAELNAQNAKYSFELNTKSDYSLTIAIPEAIKSDLLRTGFSVNSTGTQISYTSVLSNMVNLLNNLKRFATEKKAANTSVAEWGTFLNDVTAQYTTFDTKQRNLIATQGDLLITISHKNAENSTLQNQSSSLNGVFVAYTSLINSVGSDLNDLESLISNLKSDVDFRTAALSGFKADLTAWLNGYTFNGGSYESKKQQLLASIADAQSRLSNSKAKFDALTVQKDALVKLINDYK